MKNATLMKLNRELLTASILSTVFLSQSQAAPLGSGSVLAITQGTGSSTNVSCTSGSCFGMEVAPGLVIWTDFGPGTDGGIVVGKNQESGGQENFPSPTNNTTCQISNAWNFFANFGCFYTPAGSTNVFDDTSCAGASCIGSTELNSWNVAWNGNSVPMGSATGCNSPSCSADQLAGIFITEYTIESGGSIAGPYSLRFGNVVPDGDPSSFGNVKFSLILRNTTFFPTPSPSPTPTPTPTPEPVPLSIELSSLDGTNGFKLNGETFGDAAGISVSAAGDINGDGLDDLVIGASDADFNGTFSGASYVIFGNPQGFSAQFELSSLDGSNGFRLNGEAADDRSGQKVSNAGDINGDGLGDLIIGAPSLPGGNSGAGYVVFGSTQGFAAQLELSSLDGTNGFKLNSGALDEDLGTSISAAGDINGDGLDDLIIGAPRVSASYVVFGSRQGFSAEFALSSLDGSNGFRLNGNNDFGVRVSEAGDINGDGLDDLIIAAPFATQIDTFLGESYVVFGSTQSFPAQFDISSLNGSNGFRLNGGEPTGGIVLPDTFVGASVSAAGDINGDGLDDLIIGGARIDSDTGNTFMAYVVFGNQQGFAAQIALPLLDGSNGFMINGENMGQGGAHVDVSAVGDINGDGLDDIIIGSSIMDINGTNSGASYVVFGSTQGFAAQLELSSLDGSNGFRLNGEVAGDYLGNSVSEAGDMNGDGLDDLIIGAPFADPNGSRSGKSYVVFGQAEFFPTPSPSPTPTPDLTTCVGLYPQTQVTMLGKAKTLDIEETLTTTFKGHIVSSDEAKGRVTICSGSIVGYEVASTVGTAKCTVHTAAVEITGTLTDKDKLICTNKPDGNDIDRFRIKHSKKNAIAVERRWFK